MMILELYVKVLIHEMFLYVLRKQKILIIVCDALLNPTNGGVITVGTGVGDTATYYCDYGYDLIGNGTVTCQSSGHWSGLPPICKGLYHQA